MPDLEFPARWRSVSQQSAATMSWQQIIFDRETLYAEVWKEPVSTVAKRYQVSDVALRKICKKLGVPTPPLGHWAKVTAGKTPPVGKLPANHKGPTRHVRQVREDPEEPERDRRIAALLEANPVPAIPLPILKATVAETHVVVRRTARALRKREYNGRGLLHADAQDVFAMSVSAINRDRALLVLDAIIAAALSVGGQVEPSMKTKRPLLTLRGEPFEIAIYEPTRRSERELTKLELRQQQRGELHWIRDKHVFVPTGKMRLEIREEGAYSPLLTLADGSAPIETRLEIVLPELMRKAAELTIERQMQEEERERARIEREEREAIIAGRNAELERLAQIEKKVSRWHRAGKLRGYADALPPAAAIEAAWIRNAADWLDPVIDKHWPEVDVYVDDKLNDIDAD
jgi:hypothetical protein